MRESLVEAAGVKYAERLGWNVYKWSSPSNRGIHDRLHVKNSCAFSIEYKTTGKKATPKQRAEAVRLKAAGIPCRCIDNVPDAREFIKLMTTIAENGSPFLDMAVLSNDIRSFSL